MVVIDNSKYEAAFACLENVEGNGRIKISPDMFMEARNIIVEHGYAIAVNEAGEDEIVFVWKDTTYLHGYVYSGGVDMWFLNQYQCIFLRGCNEYSVELCLGTLKLWEGKKIVFVGNEWRYLIELLPEIDGKECLWEDTLDTDGAKEIAGDLKYIDVTSDLPYEEKMDRYYENRMTYDEVMTFTFLFSDKRDLGSKNPDKDFFIVDASYGNLGLFGIYHKAISLARYAKKKGFIPVMCIKNEYGEQSLYQDFQGDDLWGKFYNQPEKYELSEVLKSKNVFFPPFTYNARILQTIMDECSKGTTLTWPKGLYNDRVKQYLEEKEKAFLPYPDKTLGVLARGTDYVGTHLANHPIHASMEMVGDKIDQFLKEWGLEYVFIATEDAAYCEYYKDRFGEKAFFTDQKRYSTRPGEMLAQMHRRSEDKENGFQLGVDYILAIYLLSKCNSFMASGDCTGVSEAKRMNEGKYQHFFVFDLGRNMVTT
jgi:hypothetical protein